LVELIYNIVKLATTQQQNYTHYGFTFLPLQL